MHSEPQQEAKASANLGILSVACPFCKAGVGVGCVSLWNEEREPHYSREGAYAASKLPPAEQTEAREEVNVPAKFWARCSRCERKWNAQSQDEQCWVCGTEHGQTIAFTDATPAVAQEPSGERVSDKQLAKFVERGIEYVDDSKSVVRELQSFRAQAKAADEGFEAWWEAFAAKLRVVAHDYQIARTAWQARAALARTASPEGSKHAGK